MSDLITAKLRNGTVVLGKLYNGTPTAKTFANRTQAAAAAAKVGGEVIQPLFGRVFYVCVEAK